jgi:hypothetical protein
VRNIKGLLNITTKREKTRATICSAIGSRRVIEFYYHGGYRTVEPFCLGVVRSGEADNESLICYQTGGLSELKEAVGWKLYRASEMEDIEITRERFNGDRPGYDPANIDMTTVYCWVTPVKEAEDRAKEAPKKAPLPEKVTPLPVDMTPRQTAGKILNHNQLMKRFRFTHPAPITELYTNVSPGPAIRPIPESVESKIRPLAQVFGQSFTLSGKPAQIGASNKVVSVSPKYIL